VGSVARRKKQAEEAGVEEDQFALEEERDRSVHLCASVLVLLVFQCKAVMQGMYWEAGWCIYEVNMPNIAVLYCNIVWNWNWNRLELEELELESFGNPA